MFRIFGPPGTGKTSNLLDMVDKALASGMNPQKIAFLAFTRKAANEAKERASKRFGLDPKEDLIYFRTLHSLAYRSLSIRSEQIMSRGHYADLSSKVGIELQGSVLSEHDDTLGSVASDHPILALINLARLKKTDLRKEYNQSQLQHTWFEVDYVARSYQKFKEVNGLLDYTDMLEMFVKEKDSCPEFDLCMLDEAQDLSPMQWDIAHKLDAHSKKMYCAGDDDQAIYLWAGADYNHFIHLDGDAEVLQQSYRIPHSVHGLADKIVKRISNRFPKTYLPRQQKGKVDRIVDMSNLDMSDGSWLILTQANYMMNPLVDELKTKGLLFERNNARSIPEKLSIAVNGWERLRHGNTIDLKTAETIYSYMTGNNIKIARGCKKLKPLPDNLDEVFTFDLLVKHHGLLAKREEIWHQAMDRIPDVDRAYVTALLRSGEKFNAKPRIKMSTIHGSKGGEADNVVLFTDLSTAAMQQNTDDLHRVFYVGVTRTKENLYLVEPQDINKGYII
jgi:DNA helicase II / ATP-dependent DNA helicase PcrA